MSMRRRRHALELPNNLPMPREDYLTVQRVCRGWQFAGFVVVGALIATLRLALLADGNASTPAFIAFQRHAEFPRADERSARSRAKPKAPACMTTACHWRAGQALSDARLRPVFRDIRRARLRAS